MSRQRFSDICTAIAASGHLLTEDPAEVLDELVLEIGEGLAVDEQLEFDALAGWIFNHLAEHPMSLPHLVRWVRLQRPRILPEAIGHAVHELANRKVLEHDGERWRTKGLLPIGFSLRRVA